MEKETEHGTKSSNATTLQVDTKCGSSSLPMTFANTLNAMVGNGIITLAAASQVSGFGFCIVLTTFFGLITSYTNYLLALVALYPGPTTYAGLVEHHLGKYWLIFFKICNITFPASICILYSVSLSENISKVLSHFIPGHPWAYHRLFILFLFTIFISLPTSFLPNVSFLQNISLISLLLVIFYTSVFIIRLPYYSARVLVLPEYWNFVKDAVFQAAGALALSFTINQGTLHLFRSTANPTLKRFSNVLIASVLAAMGLYFIVMSTQFGSFAGVLVSNAIENYCRDDMLANATAIILSITLAATMPLQVIFLRDSLVDVIQRLWKPDPRLRYYVAPLVILLIFIFSCISKSINTVLVVGGSFSGGPLNLIFPPLLYIIVVHKSFKTINYQTLTNWFLVLLGISLTILGTSLAIKDAVFQSEPIDQIMYWCDHVIF